MNESRLNAELDEHPLGELAIREREQRNRQSPQQRAEQTVRDVTDERRGATLSSSAMLQVRSEHPLDPQY